MQKGNLLILVFCQLISATGSIVMIALGGIIGSDLTSNQSLATLPVTMIIVATAATTIPATFLMRRIGRSKGFAIASFCSGVAVCVAAMALQRESFGLFVVAGMLFGINMAFTQQYRYAAAESVPPRFVPRAISFVLLGSIGGALIGPELITYGRDLVEGVPYAGTMFALAGLYVVQALLFLRLESAGAGTHDIQADMSRPLKTIVMQPVYIVAVLGGTVGFGLMALVMTATPLSMHVIDGFSVEQVKDVIRAHVLSMYIPSLFSGFLIERFGVSRLMLTGAVTLLITSIIGLQGHMMLHYWWALILLGVGWNFLYVGGTTMLTYTYSIEERFRAQAINELLVFGTSAIASLAAGTVIYYFGWFRLMMIPIPILVVVAGAIIYVRRDSLLVKAAQAG